MSRNPADEEFRKWKRKLERIGSDLFPQTISETINVVAREAHDDSSRNLQSRFTLRNSFTQRSLRFYASKPKSNWTAINAISGSISPYIALHDAGGDLRPKRGRVVAQPTLYARGGSRARTKRRRFYLGQELDKRKMYVGVPRGTNRPRGIYERKGRGLKLVHSLIHSTIRIEGRHWHTDAVQRKYTKARMTAEFVTRAEARAKYITGRA